MSEQTTNTTTTTPQGTDEVPLEAAGDATNVQPAEKPAEAPVASGEVESTEKPVEEEPKMDTTETPVEKQEDNSTPAEAAPEKPAEVPEKPASEPAAEKPTEQPQASEPAPETQEDVKPVIEGDKVAEPEKVAETEKVVEENKAADNEKVANNEEKPMKVDEEPTKEVQAPAATAPEQPQPPKQNDLPTRQYLDATVVPILHSALSQLAKIRPDDPIQYLCTFLQEQKNNFASDPK